MILVLVALCGSAARADERGLDEALQDLEVTHGLEVSRFASEPAILSPSNLAIDARGRVWICEVVNYHHNRHRRPEGDRILILEDHDGDGRADETKVYYQGRDVDSAMGICVLGKRVIVTSTPRVWVFTDEDGDDRPDRQEQLFRITGDPQHDHSAHSVSFGPDGRLYWNFGNTGKGVADRSGQPMVNVFGHRVFDDRTPYQGGMVFRSELDGSRFEVLGHNFRNNYEAAVDSFGTVWQTDNDDDGNRGARMSYVMDYGNFGYRDELTGAHWRTPRTGQSEDLSARHFHQNDPGVVPNTIVTGNGAPGGITVYDGQLFPELVGLPIHTDTVTRRVHLDRVVAKGAGYGGEADTLLRSRSDAWFRPVDVAVAPDGSIFVTDWHDPFVGGHRQADTSRGRVYRIARPGMRYGVPHFDLSTPEGAVAALSNGNEDVRYQAWTRLRELGDRAEPALRELFAAKEAFLRARALWLLGRLAGRGHEAVEVALADPDPRIRVVGVRLARQLDHGAAGAGARGRRLEEVIARVVKDPSVAVRREAAIALRGRKGEEASRLWTELALLHDGDRFYLEALGIGADGLWDDRFAVWMARLERESRKEDAAVREVAWRSRSSRTPTVLAHWIATSELRAEILRAFRAFDFQSDSRQKREVLERLTELDAPLLPETALLAMRHYPPGDPAGNTSLAEALERAYASQRGRAGTRAEKELYLEVVRRFGSKEEGAELLRLALESKEESIVAGALALLGDLGQAGLLRGAALSGLPSQRRRAVELLGRLDEADSLAALALDENESLALRGLAVSVCRGKRGRERLLRLLEEDRLPESLHLAVREVLLAAGGKLAEATRRKLRLPATADQKPLPTVKELARRRGGAERGAAIFQDKGRCATCHQVKGEGRAVGPDLSTAGGKLGREALYESIIFPSRGISHGYEAWTAVTRQGEAVSGVLRTRTDERVTLVTAEALTRSFAIAELTELREETGSLMPADLYKVLGQDELVDLVEYLAGLKAEASAPKE